MVNVYLHGPEWFFGVDASLETLATIIALFVAVASFKVYRMTREKKYAYFTASFVLLTLSFLARALTDSLLEDVFDKIMGKHALTISQQYAPVLFFTGYVTHIFLALTAYVILLLVTHKITDKRLISLLFIMLIPSMLLSGSYFLSFYGLSIIFLGFITNAYYQNYRKICKLPSCLVFIAFLFLTIAQVLFLLEAVYKPLYVAAHVTQAAGYVVLLFALIRILLKPRNSEEFRR